MILTNTMLITNDFKGVKIESTNDIRITTKQTRNMDFRLNCLNDVQECQKRLFRQAARTHSDDAQQLQVARDLQFALELDQRLNAHLDEQNQDRLVAQALEQEQEDRRVAQALEQEDRRVAQAQKDRHFAQALEQEDRRVAQEQEDRRVAQALEQEDRRVAQAQKDRRVAQQEERDYLVAEQGPSETSNGDAIIVKCPWCGAFISISLCDRNCGIFRHGATADGQVSPHARGDAEPEIGCNNQFLIDESLVAVRTDDKQ